MPEPTLPTPEEQPSKQTAKLPRIQVTLPPLLYDTMKAWSDAEGGNFAAFAGNLLCDRIRQARRSGEFDCKPRTTP